MCDFRKLHLSNSTFDCLGESDAANNRLRSS